MIAVRLVDSGLAVGEHAKPSRRDLHAVADRILRARMRKLGAEWRRYRDT